MSKLKKLSMIANYTFASEIIELFDSENVISELEILTFLKYNSPLEFIKELIEKGEDSLIQQQKYTFLHYFIHDYILLILASEKYYLSDTLCEDNELESFILFFKKLYGLIGENETTNFSYVNKLEQFDKKFEKSDFELEKEYKELVNDLFDNFLIEFEKTIEEMIEAVFYLLYQNKKFLFKFNEFFSKYVIKNYLPKEFYNEHGHIIRKSYLPEWLRRAIYYRDNGRCQHCHKDLSGTISILEDKELHYDHVIPLEKGGTNDSTNYQLLCKECNQKKAGKHICPEYYYQMYW